MAERKAKRQKKIPPGYILYQRCKRAERRTGIRTVKNPDDLILGFIDIQDRYL